MKIITLLALFGLLYNFAFPQYAWAGLGYDLEMNPKTSQMENVLIQTNNMPIKVSKRWVTVTAYSSTVDQTDSTPFITASGKRVRHGIVAANFLKFGTKIVLPSLFGSKVFVVEDRMKTDYLVDIWFSTREQAKQFGKRRTEMIILD